MLIPSTAPRIPTAQTLLAVPAAALGLYYLSLVLSRPDVPPGARVEDPAQYGWPAWYGKLPQSTGETNEKSARVLLLIDHKASSTNRAATYALIPQLSRQPNLQVSIWGPDASDWNATLSVNDNLASTGCPYDWIWRRGDEPGFGRKGCPDSVWVDDLGAQAEVNPESDINLLHSPMQVLSERFELSTEGKGDDWKMALFGHVPPSASPDEFYPLRTIASQRSITYFPDPSTHRSDWPSMPWGNSWKIYQPSEPAYKPGHDVFAEDGKVTKRYRAERDRLAKAMRSSGICVFEEWSSGIVNDRYVQAMLSGCLVVSAPPATNHDATRNLLLIVPASNDTLPDVSSALDSLDDTELKRRKVEAVAYARHHFTPRVQTRVIEGFVEQWRSGARGFVLPASFRLDCETSGGTLAWC